MENEIKQMFQEILGRLDGTDCRLDKMECRLDKMDSRLDVLEVKQDRLERKMDDLQLDVKIAERDIRRDIHKLNDEMDTVIEIMRQNALIPAG